jgi:hypothetical protein
MAAMPAAPAMGKAVIIGAALPVADSVAEEASEATLDAAEEASEAMLEAASEALEATEDAASLAEELRSISTKY